MFWRLYTKTTSNQLETLPYMLLSIKMLGPLCNNNSATVAAALHIMRLSSRRAHGACVCTVGTVLLGQSVEELSQLAKDTGQSAYRGKQLYDGLMHGVRQLDHFNQACYFFLLLCMCHTWYRILFTVSLCCLLCPSAVFHACCF